MMLKALAIATTLRPHSCAGAFSPPPPFPATARPHAPRHRRASALRSDATATSVEPPLNPLLSQIKPSKTVEVFSLVKQMEAEGEEVTSLCVGEPDFAPPSCVLEAAAEAMRAGQTTYTAVTGTAELRAAISEDLRSRKGVEYDPLTEVVVGNGAKQCVYQGLLAACGVGDEVIVPAPYWPSYPEMALLVGASPVILETAVGDGYLINPAELEKCLDEHPKAKVLMLCECPKTGAGGITFLRRDLRLSKSILQAIRQIPPGGYTPPNS